MIAITIFVSFAVQPVIQARYFSVVYLLIWLFLALGLAAGNGRSGQKLSIILCVIMLFTTGFTQMKIELADSGKEFAAILEEARNKHYDVAADSSHAFGDAWYYDHNEEPVYYLNTMESGAYDAFLPDFEYISSIGELKDPAKILLIRKWKTKSEEKKEIEVNGFSYYLRNKIALEDNWFGFYQSTMI